MSEPSLVGNFGGLGSGGGQVSWGYDPYGIWVTWIGYEHIKDSTYLDKNEGQFFGYDEHGQKIILTFQVPIFITRKQAIIAQNNGAILISPSIIS